MFCTRYILFHHLWKSHQCNWQSEKFLFEGLAPLEKEWDQKYLVSAIVLQFAREVKFSLFWLRFTLAKILYLYLHSLRGLLQCPGLCWYKSIAKVTCSNQSDICTRRNENTPWTVGEGARYLPVCISECLLAFNYSTDMDLSLDSMILHFLHDYLRREKLIYVSIIFLINLATIFVSNQSDFFFSQLKDRLKMESPNLHSRTSSSLSL